MFTFRHDPRLDVLRRFEVFADLSRSELSTIASLMTATTVPAGSPLCVQGRLGDQVFAVVEGDVAISQNGTPVAMVQAGALVGEMAVLDSTVRSATAVALTDAAVLVMSTREFRQLLLDHPRVATRIRSLGASRRQDLSAA